MFTTYSVAALPTSSFARAAPNVRNDTRMYAAPLGTVNVCAIYLLPSDAVDVASVTATTLPVFALPES